MVEHCFSVDKAQVFLHQLVDMETLLILCGILPLLHQMYMLIKIVQTRTLYLVEYTKARKMACLLLDNLYITPVEAFDGIDFTKWKELIDIQNPQNILKLDENNCVCISVRDNLVPLHILQKHGRTIKEKPVTRDEFQVVIQEVKSNLTNVARVLTT